VPFLESCTRTLFMLDAVMTISRPPFKVYVSGFAYHTSFWAPVVCHRIPKLDPPTTLGSILWLGRYPDCAGSASWIESVEAYENTKAGHKAVASAPSTLFILESG
jgi:hypothetical protein